MFKKKHVAHGVFILIVLSAGFFAKAGKTEWVILQTRYTIEGESAERQTKESYSQCLCGYCGGLLQKPNEDNMSEHMFCELCGVKMARFISKNGFPYDESSGKHLNIAYYEALENTFPDAKKRGVKLYEVIKTIGESVSFEKDFYGYMQTTKNAETLAIISSFSAHCNDCEASVPMESLTPHAEEHFVLCNQCGKESSSDRTLRERESWLKNHEKAIHTHACRHCDAFFSDKVLRTHQESCPEQEVSCQACQKEMSLGNHLTHVLQHWNYRNREGQTVNCPVCKYDVFLPDYQQHYEIIHAFQEVTPCAEDACQETYCTGESMLEHYIHKHAGIVSALMLKTTGFSSSLVEAGDVADTSGVDNDRLYQIIRLTRNLQSQDTGKNSGEIDELKQQVAALKLENEKIRDYGHEFYHDLYEVMRTNGMVRDGTFLWQIRNVSHHMKNDSVEPFSSPAFYSGRYGYKVCGKIYFHGIDEYENTHVAVKIAIMPGENDRFLHWPYSGTCCAELVPQDKKCRQYREKPFLSQNKAPQQCETLMLNKKLCGIDKMRDKAYIRNDTMFVFFSVTPCTGKIPLTR